MIVLRGGEGWGGATIEGMKAHDQSRTGKAAPAREVFDAAYGKFTRGCTKKDGKPRKQFVQWRVPTETISALGLKDGDECQISVHLEDFKDPYHRYTLTSDREFRLERTVGER